MDNKTKITLKEAKAMKKQLVQDLNAIGMLNGTMCEAYIQRELLLNKITKALQS